MGGLLDSLVRHLAVAAVVLNTSKPVALTTIAIFFSFKLGRPAWLR